MKAILLGAAALAVSSLNGMANAASVVTAGTAGTTGDTALYLDQLSEISTSDGTATNAELMTFLGRPDDHITGLGQAWVTYDLGSYRLVDGAGADFNVYEYDAHAPEFGYVDILVSANAADWFDVTADVVTLADLAGDEAHGGVDYRRSYDLGNAMSGLGVSELRYVRLAGTAGSLTIDGLSGFDLDAVGYRNFVSTAGAVPEPASWALMILGFAMAGQVLRRLPARMALA